MTFRQWAEEFCVERGMFSNDAKKVVELLMADPSFDSMQCRWEDDVSGYPPQMQSVLIVSLKEVAISYIEDKKPKAWYKSLFQS